MNKFDLVTNKILEQQFIDMSIFGNESEDYRVKRPGLYGRVDPDRSALDEYKKITRESWLGFLVWNVIQAIDVYQITSIPDILAAVDDYKKERSAENAAWLVVESVFLVIGSVPALEFLKNSFRKSAQSKELLGKFFKTQILPRKQEIFDVLVKLPGGAAVLATVKDAFSVLENEEPSSSTPNKI
jgi:hypothetical protein